MLQASRFKRFSLPCVATCTMLNLLDRIKGFQTSLLELGVARGVLALPAPRMAALPAPSAESAGAENLFAHLITEPEIVAVARDLFVSGFYNQAVSESLKALDKFVQEKSQCADRFGVALMTQVFNDTRPVLVWGSRKTQSEKDEQK